MSPNSCWFEEQNPCYEAVQFVLPEKLQPEKRSALAQGAKYSPARCIGWRANREQLEKVLHEFVDSDLPGKEHLVRYLIYQYRQNRRPNTLKSNSSNLKQFLGFLKTEKKSTVEEIDKKSVEAFVEYEQDRGMKPATVRTRLESVRAFLRFLIEEELICQDVLSKRVRVRVPESLPRAIDPEDVKELLSVIDNVRNRAMVLILLRTGMRIGEALNIRVQDIELKSRRIFIHEAKKTGSGRVVYFSNDAKEAIEAWLKEKDPREEVLFYGKSYEQLTYAAARALFQRYLKKAGLLGKVLRAE